MGWNFREAIVAESRGVASWSKIVQISTRPLWSTDSGISHFAQISPENRLGEHGHPRSCPLVRKLSLLDGSGHSCSAFENAKSLVEGGH